MLELAEFISKVNSWFDIFNSRRMYHKSNKLGCAYGLNMVQQDALLDKFYEEIKVFLYMDIRLIIVHEEQ